DDHHPVGASHHQKVVVIDDQMAFAGGMDLTFARWDTSEHRPNDARRAQGDGTIARPMHDVQVAMSGDTAKSLGDLFRARWKAATGETLPADGTSSDGQGDAWPAAVRPDLHDVDVAIARTVPPATTDATGVREIEALTLGAIAAAKRSIFIENQYLTAAVVGDALSRRLAEPDGPEVVLVLPRDQGGWLEQSSMGVLRDRLLGRLRASDRHGRLRTYYPVIPELPDDQCLGVHSKVLIVDDTFLKIGSANLSNRSMGLDTECDVALEATSKDDGKIARAIAELRIRLLSEHLGADPAEVEAHYAASSSLIEVIESHSGGPRRLAPLPLPQGEEPALNLAMMDGLVVDPERPIAPEKLIEEFVPLGSRKRARRSVLSYAALLVALLVLGAVWRFTPIREFMVVERLVAMGQSIRDDRFAFFYVMAAFLVGGLLFFPITLLTAATALLFEPWRGFAFAITGGLSSACVTYAIGRTLGRPMVERMLRTARMRRFRDELRRRSFAAIFGARLVPVGSFSLINMLAGALEVRFRSYFLGNVFGLLPGILGLTLFADRLHDTLVAPNLRNVATLTLFVAAIVAVLLVLRRLLHRAGRAEGPRPPPELQAAKES
ncbi:MAG: VTT domain-containing protein, partial [Polyangiaceae bacterium]